MHGFCEQEELSHLDKYAVAKIIEYASRLAESQNKLSTRFNDLSQIIIQLSEIPFTPDTIEYIHSKYNRFRQIVQLINQMETFAKDNNFPEITKEIMEQII